LVFRDIESPESAMLYDSRMRHRGALVLSALLSIAGCKRDKGADSTVPGAGAAIQGIPQNAPNTIVQPSVKQLPPPRPAEVVMAEQQKYYKKLEERRKQEYKPLDYKEYHQVLEAQKVFPNADGRMLFLNTCGSCHGADGRANVLNPQPNIPNLSSARIQHLWTDDFIFKIIEKGHKHSSVVGFGQLLEAEQIKLIVGHVRTLVREK
jgi:mono/diheme cytochrome c family protein